MSQEIAIAFHCRTCQEQIDAHFAYLEDGKLYVQGPCSECGEDARFSCDDLLVHLMEADKEHKGNGRVQ